MTQRILCIAGPTASGKSARAVEEALARNGEIISVDSRKIYRGLDIGTEKMSREEMRGIPHHLIDILEAGETYSAGDFVHDATRLIENISSRGKLPILVGGTHFYFDALLRDLPGQVSENTELRGQLELLPTEELFAQTREKDPRRAADLDPHNRRRLIRALEIIEAKGAVPVRARAARSEYEVEWITLDPPAAELRTRIEARLRSALERGLIEEVRQVRDQVGDARLDELGLEYKIIGEYLRDKPANLEVGLPGSPTSKLLLETLQARLWQYARRQKAWLRKLRTEII